MKSRLFAYATGVMGLAALSLAAAEGKGWKLPPETARFKPGKGVELALGHCLICHSADYVSSQPPMGQAAWLASVTKMREKYGAPLPADKVDALVEYLTRQYGKP